ncbi:hypothetical protein T01_10250 [Trichinella spiralis]|uniref:RNA-directed DNA polymerase n=1 Tax=Trichinella spiralis TaxID=6334 RepID=A0A0V1BU38_TRISP|nr:hypothetical protein T01_10250 [Trichinella spiralis]
MARRSLMVRWGSGSKPPRNKPLIYRRAASRGTSGEDHPAVSKWTSVECECCDDTNVEDGYTKTRPRERRRAGQDRLLRSLWSQRDRIVVHEGTICRKWETPDTGETRLLQVIPRQRIPEILAAIHNQQSGAHLGLAKTLAKVRQRYYWPQQREDVEDWCRACQTCAARAVPTKKPQAPMQLYEAVLERAGREQRRQKFWEDRKAHGPVYEPGDQVWMQVPDKTKLGAYWDGPYEVQKKLDWNTRTTARGSPGKDSKNHGKRGRPGDPPGCGTSYMTRGTSTGRARNKGGSSGPPVADGPLGQRIKAAAQQAADLYKGRKPGDCQQDNGGIKFQLTHPGAPCGEILLYIGAAKTIRRLVSGRAWSASAATIRTWKMATRRRDRASEDEPAKSDNGRTGADPEEANQTTPPSGSLQRYHYCSARRRPTTNNCCASLDNEEGKKNEATVSRSVLEDQERVRWNGLLLAARVWCLAARMLPTKRELGKRGGRAGSNRTDDTDAEMNPKVNTGASSFGDDRGSNPVEATNEPARESGLLHHIHIM